MNMPLDDRRDRRQWFVDAGRTVLVGGLAALTLLLGWRARRGNCINAASACEACRLWNGCQLPRARDRAAAIRAQASPGQSRL